METQTLRPGQSQEDLVQASYAEPTPTMQTAGMVYDAIRGVSLELSHQGISKERNNQQQGYKFRGIDDCLNALSSLLPKYGLIITPYVETRDCVERQTKSGGSLFYVTVRVRFSFISTIDGSRHDAVLYGEAMDSADKATNKAMSAAYKYCVLLTFCIPTEAEDADSVTHDVVPQGKTSFDKFTAISSKVDTYQASGPAPKPMLAKPAFVAPAGSTVPSGGWIVPLTKGPNAQKPITDVSDQDCEGLLRYFKGKLDDPANATSRFRNEWEQAVLEIRSELLHRYPDVVTDYVGNEV